MSSSEDPSSSENEVSENDSSDHENDGERLQIREDLKSMTFEEILKLKEELGSKVYKEALLGVETKKTKNSNTTKTDFKRLNKNRPREASAKRPVPFLGAEHRNSRKNDKEIRDPRYDERSGDYDTKKFKQNYKFLSNIRRKEIGRLKKRIRSTTNGEDREELRKEMQKLLNQNVEDRRWHEKQKSLKEEQDEIQKARAEGRTPHYTTKKERRAKELVKQFEQLKKTGKLNKHLEKRRKKMTAKDRKKISFD